MKTKILALVLLLVPVHAMAIEQAPAEYFSFSVQADVKGTTEEVFETITGDISSWWDHTVSENPVKLSVDPYPGGAFMEIFDDEGHGVRHAVVTGADYGKMLRYEGPLGLAGTALLMVTTWTLAEADQGRTTVTVDVHGAGEVGEGIPEIIEKTWGYFLIQRLKPYLEGNLQD